MPESNITGNPPMPPELLLELDEVLSMDYTSPVPQAAPVPKTALAAYIHPLDLNANVKKSHDFLIGTGRDGIFPMGSASVVASLGGMMKTATLISMAVFVASGTPWAGLPVRESAVLFLAMEDDYDETMRRGIATTLAQIDQSKHDLAQRRVRFATLSGVDARLTQSAFGVTQRASAVGQIIQEAALLSEASGVSVGLIVIDHARLAIGGDLNDSGDVTELTRALAHIGIETGAAVVLLCHSPKASVNRTGDHSVADVLGSGATVDNSRFASVISTLTDDERKLFSMRPEDAKHYVALRIIKSNYSETGRVFYMRKTPVEGWGVVVPDVVTLSKPVKERVAPPSNTDTVLTYLQRHPGRFTRTSFKLHTGSDSPLGICEKAAVTALSGLIAAGRVGLRAPTAEEVVAYNLSRQAKEVLYVINQ